MKYKVYLDYNSVGLWCEFKNQEFRTVDDAKKFINKMENYIEGKFEVRPIKDKKYCFMK